MNATGTWNLVVKTPMGEQRMSAALTEEGGTLTGTMDDQKNPTGPIQEASVDGSELSWKFPVKKPFATTLSFSFRLEGDQLTGTCKPSLFPAASATGRRA